MDSSNEKNTPQNVPPPIPTAFTQPATVPPTPIFSQSDALALPKPRFRHKKWLIIFGIAALGLATLFTIFMLIMNNIYGLKKITFDNGVGSKYQLVFYRKYKLGNAKLESSPGQKTLVSEVSVAGKAPVVLYMNSGAKFNQEEWDKSHNRDCSGDFKEAFTVHNDFIGQDIHMCLISKNGEDEVSYVGTYHYKDKLQVLIVNQDLDVNSATDEASAKEVLPKVGLQVYLEDLQEIVKSIKPLE
jgi:hypothetical protein